MKDEFKSKYQNAYNSVKPSKRLYEETLKAGLSLYDQNEDAMKQAKKMEEEYMHRKNRTKYIACTVSAAALVVCVAAGSIHFAGSSSKDNKPAAVTADNTSVDNASANDMNDNKVTVDDKEVSANSYSGKYKKTDKNYELVSTDKAEYEALAKKANDAWDKTKSFSYTYKEDDSKSSYSIKVDKERNLLLDLREKDNPLIINLSNQLPYVKHPDGVFYQEAIYDFDKNGKVVGTHNDSNPQMDLDSINEIYHITYMVTSPSNLEKSRPDSDIVNAEYEVGKTKIDDKNYLVLTCLLTDDESVINEIRYLIDPDTYLVHYIDAMLDMDASKYATDGISGWGRFEFTDINSTTIDEKVSDKIDYNLKPDDSIQSSVG